MEWQAMEACEVCGCKDIQLVEDRDNSVGYSAEEWRCMRCGANCEEMPVEAAVAQALDGRLVSALTFTERLVASIAVAKHRKEAA